MKFIIDVPDTINYVYGSSNSHFSEKLPVNEKMIFKALTLNDYHMNCYFNDEDKIIIKKYYSIFPFRKYVKKICVFSKRILKKIIGRGK